MNQLDQNYTPSGNLKKPMLMLSGSFDPNIPAFNQTSYLATATNAGRTQYLVQRTLPSIYHCYHPFSDVVSAFHDLVLWTQAGVKPTH